MHRKYHYQELLTDEFALEPAVNALRSFAPQKHHHHTLSFLNATPPARYQQLLSTAQTDFQKKIILYVLLTAHGNAELQHDVAAALGNQTVPAARETVMKSIRSDLNNDKDRIHNLNHVLRHFTEELRKNNAAALPCPESPEPVGRVKISNINQ